MKIWVQILRITLLFTFSLMPLLAISQEDIARGRAYRNPTNYHRESPIAISTFAFTKLHANSVLEGYRVHDLGEQLAYDDFDLKVWLITDGHTFYLNSKRHGFRNRYLRFQKKGNYYYFRAEPLLFDAHQYPLLKNAFSLNGWLGVACADRRLTYYNQRLQHNVLDLENGATFVLTIEYICRLVKQYPKIKEEFAQDTTDLTLKRLLYYLDKVDSAWQSENKELNTPDL